MNEKRLSTVLLLVMLLCGVAQGQTLSILPQGGRFDTPPIVTIQSSNGLTVRYTLNGSVPTANDAAFLAPLKLSEKHYSCSNIYQLRNCPEKNWRQCDDVDRIIVVRAALFDDAGVCRSEVKTEAYVVSSLLDRTIKLPVVSLCVDSADLFDFDSGIFVPGRHFDETNIDHSGNYCQKGTAWERKASFCFIENGATIVNQDCGLRIHGNRTRGYMQKGFSLYARKEYGKKTFSYPLFGADGPDSFKRLVLRPWMGSWTGAGIEDWLSQQLAKPAKCDNLATRPVVLFLNGEYWGIYFLEEKADEHYIEDRYGIDKDHVDLILNWGDEVENGNGQEWNALYNWLQTADLTREEDYAYLAARIDVDALLDYMLLQVFILNVDWPSNNARQWSADGSPWRWIFFDGDAAFSIWKDQSALFSYITCDDPAQHYPASPHSTLLFRRLLANETFRKTSIDRFSKLVYHHWGYGHSAPLLDKIADQVGDEVKRQSDRFGSPKSKADWRARVRQTRQFLQKRTDWVVDNYARFLDADISKVNATLYPNPSRSGATLCYESEYGGVLEIHIFDARGRCVSHQTIDLALGVSTITLSQLPPGVYYIRTSDGHKPLRWVTL
ncbi:MAG: CotH kinase family protein [Bacteroidales bacterium]|nr:CotH kinase family protein [Bacteroidales bacterium]